MKRITGLLSAVALAAGFAFSVPASAGFEIEGWYTGEDAERAMEVAEERGIPIALIYTSFAQS